MTSEPATFPILRVGRVPGFPDSVPWWFVAPHEAQALANHDQTLDRLAQRGGVDWVELEGIVTDQPWDGRSFDMSKERDQYKAAQRTSAERVCAMLRERAGEAR